MPALFMLCEDVNSHMANRKRTKGMRRKRDERKGKTDFIGETAGRGDIV